MDQQIMSELERASEVVMAAPNLVSHEQRQAAENVILEFRKTKHPYNICRYILENCKIDYVLFQAATTVRESIIREWTLLSAEDIESLRSFLLRYITQHISLQSYVREQILQTMAVILKRGTLDTKGASLDSLFNDVTQLISSGNVTMQLVACSMLTALLNEYSSSSRTSSVGFTWEFHTKCKRHFEEHDLQRVFLFSLQVLNEIEKQPSPLPRETTAVLNRFLSITEQVLCWEFTPKTNMIRRHVGSFDTTQGVTLKPHEQWRETLLDASLVQLIFRIHKKARHNSEMAHHSIQCLGQLASLNGPVFADDKARTQYLNNYIEAFLQLLSSIDVQDYECLGVASIFKNLVMMYPAVCLISLSRDLYTKFVENLKRLTCAFGTQAALEEEMQKEETLHMEAYEKMLGTWMELITTKKDNVPLDLLKTHAVGVFDSYVHCHISPPDGCRMQTLDSQPDTEEVDEIEEDDREKFSDQLCSVGALGRLMPEHSIAMVTRTLEDRITRLHGQLQRIHQERLNSDNLSNSFDTTHINILQEDIHWLILVTAHVLTEEAEGETPMIPSDIMDYSIKQSSDIDLNTTLKVLASPSSSIDSIPGASTHSDNVIRLISAVFKLCEVEKNACTAKMVDALSPQVTSSTMWLLRRWSRSYLLPDENYYTQISKALWAAFGRETEGAQWTISFILDKIVSSLLAWGSEEKTLTDILQFFVMLVENKPRAVFITKCEGLWNLVKCAAHNEPPVNHLPASAMRLLYKGFVMAGPGISDENLKVEFWKLVLQALHDKFYHSVCSESFLKNCHSVVIKEEIIHILECLCGVAEGSRVDNVDKLFGFLHPLMVESVKLLDVYHNYEDVVPLILEWFSEVVQKFLCFLNKTESQKLYEVCLSAVQTYSKHNTGKRVQNASEEEEERYNDILIVMELLTNLLTKDFVDFGDGENETPASSGDEVTCVDVVLYGLNTIIPLMSEDLLRFPSLCSQYFKLITFLAEIHPDKFTSLPGDLFKNLMASIELGLNAYGVDIMKLCLDSLYSLATHVFQSNEVGTVMHTMLRHFLKIVFRMLLTESFNMDLLDTASSTLFCLICCHQDEYRQLVNEILASHIDQAYKERLLEAFNNLTPPSLTMTLSRHNKLMFMENFNHFLIDVRGFLCVK